MKRITQALALALIACSCASTTKVKVNTAHTGGIPIDTLNLISTMIGPLIQPVLPLIDAAAFNDKTNRISDQILDEQQKSIETYRQLLVADLMEKVHKHVKTGADFQSEAARKYRVKDGIQIDNKNFPVVFFGEGDLNFIEFGKGKNMNSILSDEKLKGRIAKVASDLGAKSILLCYNRLTVLGVGMFGSTGTLRLEMFLFLYDSNGNPLLDAQGWTKATNISGKNLSDYKFQLDSFKELSGLMSLEVAKYIK